nr:MAG TPA: hypothetical protein [Caudoviricetes sp.]
MGKDYTVPSVRAVIQYHLRKLMKNSFKKWLRLTQI